MIRINRGGLSDRESASVRKPLAENNKDGLEIHTLGENLGQTLEDHFDVFRAAIESIDHEPSEGPE